MSQRSAKLTGLSVRAGSPASTTTTYSDRSSSCDGWLDHAVTEPLDVRTLCLARETLAYHDALADFAFAMQGLGSGPITLFGDAAVA